MSVEDLVQRALTEHARDVSAVPDVEKLVARGTRARRRRRLVIVASITATMVIGAIVVGPLLGRTARLAPVVGTPSPSASVGPTASAAPSAGSGFFAGSANIPVSFTMPDGWESGRDAFVLKSGADPAFGVGFYDVANLYDDGCRWDPGRTAGRTHRRRPRLGVRKVADLRATAPRPVTVDGFAGKKLQFTVPDYDPATCRDETYALLQADNAGTNTAQPGDARTTGRRPPTSRTRR